MSEGLSVHRHDGFLWFDYDFYYDKTVEDAVRNFDAAAQDGVSGAEVMALLRSSTDEDRITAREARQMYGALNDHFYQMDANAQHASQQLMQRLDAAFPGGLQPPDFIMRGFWSPAPLIYHDDEQFKSAGDYSRISGDDLKQLVNDTEAVAEPLAHAIQSALNALRL
jgi:hypothetical protein